MFLPALPCLRRLKQAMVVVLPEGFRSLKRTLARLDPDEKLTISVIYPCFPWFSFDALGLFYESRLGHWNGEMGRERVRLRRRFKRWQSEGAQNPSEGNTGQHGQQPPWKAKREFQARSVGDQDHHHWQNRQSRRRKNLKDKPHGNERNRYSGESS